MPALVAGIHVLNARNIEDVDGRDKPGHDDGERLVSMTVGISRLNQRFEQIESIDLDTIAKRELPAPRGYAPKPPKKQERKTQETK